MQSRSGCLVALAFGFGSAAFLALAVFGLVALVKAIA